MPTAARLVGAITFPFLAFVLSTMIIPLLPEGTRIGSFWILNCLVAMVFGWRMMGVRATKTFVESLTGGITTAVTIYCVALFLHSGYKMILLSMRKIYAGPVEAVKAVFGIGFDWTMNFATVGTISTLIIGGMICGWMSWNAHRKWG